MSKKDKKKYTLELTKDQLYMVARCVEDCTRFAAGQLGMSNTLMEIGCDCPFEVGGMIETAVKERVTPGLMKNESYGWSGGCCENDYQRKFIARGYALYREILHYLSVERHNEDPEKYGFDVYLSDTLTCEEGGELPKINESESVREYLLNEEKKAIKAYKKNSGDTDAKTKAAVIGGLINELDKSKKIK